jgi:hypothetical protein
MHPGVARRWSGDGAAVPFVCILGWRGDGAAMVRRCRGAARPRDIFAKPCGGLRWIITGAAAMGKPHRPGDWILLARQQWENSIARGIGFYWRGIDGKTPSVGGLDFTGAANRIAWRIGFYWRGISMLLHGLGKMEIYWRGESGKYDPNSGVPKLVRRNI